MGEIECKVPQPLNYAGARKIFLQVGKDMPNLKKNVAAWEREAARRAGIDEPTWLKLRAGNIKSATPGRPAAASAEKSFVPSTKTSTPTLKPQKPAEIIAEKPIVVPEVLDVAPSSTKFDWSKNTSMIKDAQHRAAAQETMDLMARVVGKRALEQVDVNITSKGLGKGVVGSHQGTLTTLHPELFTSKFAQEAARLRANGHWVKTNNLTPSQGTMVHELGHDIMERYLNAALAKEALKGLADEIGQKLLLGNENVVANWLSKNAGAIGKKVSRYGTEDPHELYAEMWTMYVDDPIGCPPYIKHFGDVVSARLRKL